MSSEMKNLQQRIKELESQLQEATSNVQHLKDQQARKEEQHIFSLRPADNGNIELPESSDNAKLPLLFEEYPRYARQLILPEVGIEGQLRLKASSALIVGAGGLGCPAAAYMAGAGVGCLGIVDGDCVEADSVKDYIRSLNPLVKCHAYHEKLSTANALDIMSQYDLILDCTDLPGTRYLISDAAVLLGKPVVSASALRTEGQLIVLNHPVGAQGDECGGPCYRCIFPNPPPHEMIQSCSEGGILGPVVGTMGVMQALEAVKLLSVGLQESVRDTNGVESGRRKPMGSWLLFSAFSSSPFRSIRLRGRRDTCRACSSTADINRDSFVSDENPYSQLCAIPAQLLSQDERISVNALAAQIREKKDTHVVVDVREKPHYDVFKLHDSINIPFSELTGWEHENDWLFKYKELNDGRPIHVICRLGNDSQLAVQKFKSLGMDKGGGRYLGDVEGGWQAWRKQVPGRWPEF